MTTIRKSGIVFAASVLLAAAGVTLSGTGANAAEVICVESTDGCFVHLNNSSGITVASDGEGYFDPFHFGQDTSDGIVFNVGLGQVESLNPYWVQLYNAQSALLTNTWVLPANLGPCGAENEPSCEPVGQFVIHEIQAVTDQFLILESDGQTVSDVITLSPYQDGVLLTFASDPLGVPEPAIWAMLLVGFFGIGTMMRRHSCFALAAPT